MTPISLDNFIFSKTSNETAKSKYTQLRYTPSEDKYGWFRVFTFNNRNYGLESFDITIQKTFNNGTPMFANIHIDVTAQSTNTLYSLISRNAPEAFQKNDAQARKIRVLMDNNNRLFVDLFVDMPDGITKTDQSSSFIISISNLISTTVTQRVFQDIQNYSYSTIQCVNDVQSANEFDIINACPLNRGKLNSWNLDIPKSSNLPEGYQWKLVLYLPYNVSNIVNISGVFGSNSDNNVNSILFNQGLGNNIGYIKHYGYAGWYREIYFETPIPKAVTFLGIAGGSKLIFMSYFDVIPELTQVPIEPEPEPETP